MDGSDRYREKGFGSQHSAGRRGCARHATRITGIGLVGLIGLSLLVPSRPAGAAPIEWAGNGHFYDAIASGGLAWSSARRRAEAMTHQGMKGHLATLTSEAENRFIISRLPRAIRDGYWLGGFQLNGILDSAAGWQWVTGEPFGYHIWSTGNPGDLPEPNDFFGPGTTDDDENRLNYYWQAFGWWNDMQDEDTSALGFVVEFEPDTSPEAPAITGFASDSSRDVAVVQAPPGTLIRILGTNLGKTGTVIFNGVPLPAEAALWAPDEVQVWVPTAPFYPFRGKVILMTNSKRADGPEFTIAAPQPNLTNLLANGSFEYPDSTGSPVRWGFTYGYPRDADPQSYRGAAIPGWRIDRGTIDVKRVYWTHAPDQGQQSIDLVGSFYAAQIQQTFYTEPGRQYRFSGWLSHNPGLPWARANVFLNGRFLTQLWHDRRNSVTSMSWTQFNHVFTAVDPQTTLVIRDVTFLTANEGTALDGLSVTPVAQ
jgi:hypothetical protein